MDVINILIWIATGITIATILFNLFRYGVRFYLPSSFILSISISFLVTLACIDGPASEWFSEHIVALIVLALLIASVLMIARMDNSTDAAKKQRKLWIAIIRIGRR